jgi:AraC-like DNA-binding protein
MSAMRASTFWPMISSTLSDALDGAPAETFDFFDLLFSADRPVHSATQVAVQFGVHDRTLASRFRRAGVPSPKRYIQTALLVRLAMRLEDPGCSIAEAARALHYSSPQHVSRHLMNTMQLSGAMFRAMYTGETAFAYFMAQLVLPYQEQLRTATLIAHWTATAKQAAQIRRRSTLAAAA